MQIGCCCEITEAPLAHAAGFDFIECKVVALQPDADDDVVAPIIAQHQASPLPIAACNVFLPRDLKIVGPTIDTQRIANYVTRGLARVYAIGSKVVVFGSGVARAIPDNFPAARAREQTVTFLQQVAEVAEGYGLTVVIEPLNRQESNTILSIPEAVEVARAVNHPSIRVLADFYHMDEEREPLAHLTEYGPWLKHIHVADTGRGAPGTGHYPYAEFATHLRAIRYTGMISIECRWRDFASEATDAARFLRAHFGDKGES